MTGTRLYGRFRGNSSHAQVSRGFEQALGAAGVLAGTVRLDETRDIETAEPPGATAPASVYTGALNTVGRMSENARHARRYCMVAPNSDKLPPGLLPYVLHGATDLLAPSDWAADVLRVLRAKSDRPDTTVHVVPHGVGRLFNVDVHAREVARDLYRRGEFRVLHFSTSDRQRKGTIELIEAWQILEAHGSLPDRATLTLVLDFAAAASLKDRLLDAEVTLPSDVTIVTRLDAAPAKMAQVLSGAHVVCQPSRAEAFGMLGPEALACGVPIVATDCTGHSQWFHKGLPGATLVLTGEPMPIDDVPGASAPSLAPGNIAQALGALYDDWPRQTDAAERNAAAISSEWAWERQLSGFVDQIRGEAGKPLPGKEMIDGAAQAQEEK